MFAQRRKPTPITVTEAMPRVSSGRARSRSKNDQRNALALPFDDEPLIIEKTPLWQQQQQAHLRRATMQTIGIGVVCSLLLRFALSPNAGLSPQSLVRAYCDATAASPIICSALLTGFTYALSDVTAQVLEQKSAATSSSSSSALPSYFPPISAGRTARFAAVGMLWVGPLLDLWHHCLEHFIPGTATANVLRKLVLDQSLQGPFMIATMYVITGTAGRLAKHGAGDWQSLIAALRQSLGDARRQWRGTWVKSLYVWAPVQILQQTIIPLQHRILVVNIVSYFWDTYMASLMKTSGAAAATSAPAVASKAATGVHQQQKPILV